MTKKHFVALADAIRDYNENSFEHGTNTASPLRFTHTQMIRLADFCESQNDRFNRKRWLGYIAGKNGKNGGKISG
jgi:hypothetical protein